MLKEQIKLANANVTQHTNDGDKTDWKIRANITGELLGSLPKNLTSAQVFNILHFARKFELEAFNKGIAFGKQEYKNAYDNTMAQYKETLSKAAIENERLADALDKETRTN